MLHTGIKISELIDSINSDDFKFAAKVIANHSINGAIRNAENQGQDYTAESIIEDWNFKEMIDLYANNFEENAIFYSNDSNGLAYHDELLIDDDTDNAKVIFEKLKVEALKIIEELLLSKL